MKLKKWIAGVCSVFLLAGIGGVMTACGGKDKGSDNGSAAPTTVTVKFDVNTTLQTNVVKDKTVEVGKRVSRPKALITEDNPTNLQLYGWYIDAECTQAWDFKNGRAQEDMTLYAKWVEQYTVSYYVNGVFEKSDLVFKGEFLEEDATLADGYKYLGSFVNEEYEIPYDYLEPVSQDSSVYIKCSEGLYLSDCVEDGELSSGGLSNYLASYIGSYGMDAKGNLIDEEGWVEEYTVTTNYSTGAKEENCTYVNFGYSPSYGDPYVEVSMPFDISKSQIIRVWFKNLGKADTLCAYFTTMLNADGGKYSETGPNYTQDFCYPNHTGAPDARLTLTADQIEMDETAEWTYVDFNLYEIYKNGYSIWGTSPFLGALRIQANYKNVNEDDLSNEFLIKAIEGIYHEVPVEDSEKITEVIETAQGMDPEKIYEVMDAQAENPLGFTFPKDYYYVAEDGEVTGNAKIYNSTQGLLFYAGNEIVGRKTGVTSGGFKVVVPEGKSIDLDTYTTLNVTLQNYGYGDEITVYLYNKEGAIVKTTMEIAKRMDFSKTYSANLYGKAFMEGELQAIEVLYTSVGVDNLIVFEDISLGEFVPYDTVGINLNDKWCYGFESNDKVDVLFDSNRSGVSFKVNESGASVTTPDKAYEATTDGYASATLVYRLPNGSDITAVTVEYKINGEFTTPYKYELDREEFAKVKEVNLPFILEERGTVQAVRLTFEGTGSVLIREIRYEAGETSLPYYGSYAPVYKGWADWYSGGAYQYDEKLQASIFTKSAGAALLSASMYIGITRDNGHIIPPHTTYNVLMTETTKVKIVYQNKTEVSKLNFHLYFAKKEAGNPDVDSLPAMENYRLTIDSKMQEYEWSTLEIEVPANFANLYLGKTVLQFEGTEIAIRVVSIETGVAHE
ncbi:MAG: hypothetical protein E7364_00895 [Clostridiales bacterium]|nr:hypothetical protein [Clostridiales bacterium]